MSILLPLLVIYAVAVAADSTLQPRIRLAKQNNGIGEMSWWYGDRQRNFIDSNAALGVLHLKYRMNSTSYDWKMTNEKPVVITNSGSMVKLGYRLPGGLSLRETFTSTGGIISWGIYVADDAKQAVVITDFSFPLPIGKMNESLPAKENLSAHKLVNGHASFCYWLPYSGYGNILLMKPEGSTSLEYMTNDNDVDTSAFFINAATTVEKQDNTWQLPVSASTIQPGKTIHYGFTFRMVRSVDDIRNILYDEGGLDVRVVPGMVIPQDVTARFLVRSRGEIKNITAAYPGLTSIQSFGKQKQGYVLYAASFKKPGENPLTITYNNGRKAYLDFFSTEPLEVLIKKRAAFIVQHQQVNDTNKWYNGLYSLWDMEQKKLLTPDDNGGLPDYCVGGSDDPSNSKPFYLSEKNVAFPDKKEIASLEFYEKNFVWGKLQRRDDEYPYPYGIYGSDNWYENRSGRRGEYNSGGQGKERMWRSFDYTTHLAIYYNLYRIAKNNPDNVHYLDAKGYLERAYHTAIAFFNVTYNIEMGEKWSFQGWCDWAYKQGNFHERYIMDIISALQQNGENDEAEVLRREWEKKVAYFIYDDPWPFGSEMYVDRTAFESSFYIAKYAKDHPLSPQEKLWYDKNKKNWYSHTHITDSATDALLEKQLKGNLALRGVLEPEFNLLGSAWESSYGLDYMSQMGGVALLDYAIQYSSNPATYISTGYQSLLSSWALMNTGDATNGYGYWYPAKENDGAVGWVFTPWQHSRTYFSDIPSKRGIWPYDGEIDHGLGGAIHGSASIVVNDSLFGLVGYGCELIKRKGGNIALIPKDGVRQRVNLLLDTNNLSLELSADGFAEDSVVTSTSGFTQLLFSVENRQGSQHTCSIYVKGLAAGNYEINNNSTMASRFGVMGKNQMTQLFVSIGNPVENIFIKKL